MQDTLNYSPGHLLEKIGSSLDIPEGRYEQAVQRYEALGRWLDREGSSVAGFETNIYPQGSFQLGTVVKPISDEEDYDIDLVCEVKIPKYSISPPGLKALIGAEVKAYARENNIKAAPIEGRRCWTLEYADGAQFHMDILPAVPDGRTYESILASRNLKNEWATQSIAITDKLSPSEWQHSNPKGYASWFRQRMVIQLNRKRAFLAESIRAHVEDVPENKVKTPLQIAVQILKRHRDILFSQDSDNKPISIIISTLAAHAYDNEEDVFTALLNIIENMDHYIENRNGTIWIPNPADPLENFADKWPDNPELQSNFNLWLERLQKDFSFHSGDDLHSFSKSLTPILGSRLISEATPRVSSSNLVLHRSHTPAKFDVEHREQPAWPTADQSSVSIKGSYLPKGSHRWNSFQSGSLLPKGSELKFQAETSVPTPFSVHWQVVNTGSEAEQQDSLRGGIFEATTAGRGGLIQNEHTGYTGMHWIECFIVSNGQLKARSGEFVVNVK